MSFLAELKRRNVVRVGIAYAIVAWVIAQVAEFAFETFGAPDWVLKSIVVVLLLGLPVALVIAWAFELTPDGVKLEKNVDRDQSITRSTGRKLDFVIIAALVVALAYFAWERYAGEPGTEPAPVADAATAPGSPGHRSIAVLPFVNMSAEAENEYFADGLSEELLNQLAQIPNLQVAGRTSSFSYKGKNEDLRVIGTTLNVANVLEGSVRRQADKVRVTAQLVRVADGYHLWSNTYDRTMDDVFVIQDDIASNVAEALKIVLDDEAWERMQRVAIRNVDAFVEFQKGLELFANAHGGAHVLEGLREGLVHFDRAIELAPEFASAYWHKSDYYAHVILEPGSTEDERAAALRELRDVLDAAWRLSSDPSLKAMVDFDRVLFSDDWTPFRDRAEKALAVTGCPEPTWIEVVIGLGYAEAALEMWGRFQHCEPLSITAPLKRANALTFLGRPDEAMRVIDEAEEIHGSSAWYSGTRQWVLLAQGKAEEALALAPGVVDDWAFFGLSSETLPLAMAGDIDGAGTALRAWEARHGRNRRNEVEIFAAMGDREQANRVAAELDASPGGTMVLLVTAAYCACGAPFDLDATPNFRERVREAGIAWPPTPAIHYPAKDW